MNPLCLPEELELYFLSALSVWQLCLLAAVSRTWRARVRASEYVWASFFCRRWVQMQEPGASGYSISCPCSPATANHLEVARLVHVLVQPLPNEQSWPQWFTCMRQVHGACGTTTTQATVLRVYKSGYYQMLALRREFLEYWHVFAQVWKLCRRVDFPILDPLPHQLRLKVSRSACVLTEVLCQSKLDLRQYVQENLHKLCPVLLTTSQLFKFISDLLALDIYPQLPLLNAELQSIRRLARRMKYFYRHGSRVLQVLRRGA